MAKSQKAACLPLRETGRYVFVPVRSSAANHASTCIPYGMCQRSVKPPKGYRSIWRMQVEWNRDLSPLRDNRSLRSLFIVVTERPVSLVANKACASFPPAYTLHRNNNCFNAALSFASTLLLAPLPLLSKNSSLKSVARSLKSFFARRDALSDPRLLSCCLAVKAS